MLRCFWHVCQGKMLINFCQQEKRKKDKLLSVFKADLGNDKETQDRENHGAFLIAKFDISWQISAMCPCLTTYHLLYTNNLFWFSSIFLVSEIFWSCYKLKKSTIRLIELVRLNKIHPLRTYVGICIVARKHHMWNLLQSHMINSVTLFSWNLMFMKRITKNS